MRVFLSLSGFLVPIALCSSPAAANSDISVCGDIRLSASANCTIEVGGGCKTKCEPVRFERQCTTKRYNLCKKSCTLEPGSAECRGSCGVDCQADCEVKPGSFECYAGCESSCEGNCQAVCQNTEESTRCTASCEATCSTECSASCEVTAPSATCQAKCDAGCQGSCRITAPYLDCQTRCQKVAIPDCEVQLKGGCETRCEEPEGALFCDGQYIDHGGNARQCIDALNDWLQSLVDVSASATLTQDCDDRSCVFEITGEVGCGMGGGPTDGQNLAVVFGLLAAVVLLSARRRRDSDT